MPWISVNDHFPLPDIPVLVYVPRYGGIFSAVHGRCRGKGSGVFYTEPCGLLDLPGATHWRPMPEPPK